MTAAAIAIRAVLLLIIAFPRLFIANLFSFRWPVGSRNAGHSPYDISPELGSPRHPISDYKPTFSQEIISTWGWKFNYYTGALVIMRMLFFIMKQTGGGPLLPSIPKNA
jgi:hypothetical protein